MDNDDVLKVLGCIGIAALAPVAITLEGYTLSVLWGWLVSPVLHVPPINIPEAIGVSMVVAMLTHQDCARKKDDSKYSKWAPLVGTISKPLTALAFGWIIHSFFQ